MVITKTKKKKGAIVAIKCAEDSTYLVGQESSWLSDMRHLIPTITGSNWISTFTESIYQASRFKNQTQLQDQSLPLCIYEIMMKYHDCNLHDTRPYQMIAKHPLIYISNKQLAILNLSQTKLVEHCRKIIEFQYTVLNELSSIHLPIFYDKVSFIHDAAGIYVYSTPRYFENGKLGFPKGSSEPNETALYTAFRELMEELQFKPDNPSQLEEKGTLPSGYTLYQYVLPTKSSAQHFLKDLYENVNRHHGEMGNFFFASLSSISAMMNYNKKTVESVPLLKDK